MSGRGPGLLSKVSIGLHSLETKTRDGRFGIMKVQKRKKRKTCSARAGGHQLENRGFNRVSAAAEAGARVLCSALHIGR